jgi:hypothetical protein
MKLIKKWKCFSFQFLDLSVGWYFTRIIGCRELNLKTKFLIEHTFLITFLLNLRIFSVWQCSLVFSFIFPFCNTTMYCKTFFISISWPLSSVWHFIIWCRELNFNTKFLIAHSPQSLYYYYLSGNVPSFSLSSFPSVIHLCTARCPTI